MQESQIRYARCPACDSEKIRPALKATDHTVSGSEYEIWECLDCSIRFTQDAPAAGFMKNFYRSEDYISHSDTQKGFINQLYHLARKQTLMNKRFLIGSATGIIKGKLLDLGAGTGAFVHYMQSHGWDSTGMEPDEKARKIASALRRVNLLPIENVYEPGENVYDAVTLWHVLEHVHDLHGYLDQLRKIVKPQHGRIFIAVPNYTSYDAGIYQKFWAGYDVPRHLYHFSPFSLKKLLQKHELQLLSIQQMWFDSYYICLLSEKYKTGSQHFLRGFLNGSLSNVKAFIDKERCSSLVYIVSK